VDKRRDAVERALRHHGVRYAAPQHHGRTTWVIQTGTGTLAASMSQAEWYCRGLADRERKETSDRSG
jgi:hypothetical protein